MGVLSDAGGSRRDEASYFPHIRPCIKFMILHGCCRDSNTTPPMKECKLKGNYSGVWALGFGGIDRKMDTTIGFRVYGERKGHLTLL